MGIAWLKPIKPLKLLSAWHFGLNYLASKGAHIRAVSGSATAPVVKIVIQCLEARTLKLLSLQILYLVVS